MFSRKYYSVLSCTGGSRYRLAKVPPALDDKSKDNAVNVKITTRNEGLATAPDHSQSKNGDVKNEHPTPNT
jgi:hypothetical protein